ncbi:MAG TPA: glycosyl hydrolase family 18 protein [Gallionellaceae bacterium]|nr:glycosyl hydrolase family 18 protein [Gallionellaceae bacterium]
MLFKGRVRSGIALLIFSLILYAGEGGARNERDKSPHYQIWGYYPYWMKDEWRKIDLGLFNQVLFFDVPVSGEGRNLHAIDWPGKWQQLIVAAKKSGTRLQPTFTLFDAKEFERIFSDPNQRELLQADMLAMVQQAGSSGLQLDVEIFSAVSVTSSTGFRLFLKSIKRGLAAKKKALSLFVLSEDRAGLYDRKSLLIPDYIVIQGYDAHWKESPKAGPVAQLDGSMAASWESSLNYFLSLGVPRHKIMMSVPFFGYEWPTASDAVGALTRGAGSEISFAPLPIDLVPAVKASAVERIRQYGSRRDPATGSPYYVYRDETGWFQGWFEDEVSLSAKFEFIKKQRLAGVAVFSLGYDAGNFQDLLRSHFRPPHSRKAPSNSGNSYSGPAQGR